MRGIETSDCEYGSRRLVCTEKALLEMLLPPFNYLHIAIQLVRHVNSPTPFETGERDEDRKGESSAVISVFLLSSNNDSSN